MTIARDKLVQHEQHLMFHCQTNFWNTWLAKFVFTISNQKMEEFVIDPQP